MGFCESLPTPPTKEKFLPGSNPELDEKWSTEGQVNRLPQNPKISFEITTRKERKMPHFNVITEKYRKNVSLNIFLHIFCGKEKYNILSFI